MLSKRVESVHICRGMQRDTLSLARYNPNRENGSREHASISDVILKGRISYKGLVAAPNDSKLLRHINITGYLLHLSRSDDTTSFSIVHFTRCPETDTEL
jgi:hypothetical protein